MHLVFAASEAVPFAKTGGLGDVVGALPRALAELGHDVTLIMPYYRLLAEIDQPIERGMISVPLLNRKLPARVFEIPDHDGVRVLLIDYPEFFARRRLYTDDAGNDFRDNAERFILLSRAVFEALNLLQLPVDCLHVHDWQAALVPVYLRHAYHHQPRFHRVASVLTIHNLAFQGLFPAEKWPLLGLPETLYGPTSLEYFGQISFLKGGITSADIVSTVSTTYAREMQGPEFGCGLDGVLRERADDLVGIVNGIDYDAWNPETDPFLPHHFSAEEWLNGKGACKKALLAELQLSPDGNRPLIGMVGRLTEQKGVDLIVETLPELMRLDLRVAILGTGDAKYQVLLERLASRYPERIALRLQFDEALSHRIYAASDMFLMPSRFEPCGLSQLYSLRYGTLPIVRAVGGLADTVRDVNPATLIDGSATGVRFLHYTAEALLSAIRRAVRLMAQPEAWNRVIHHGMTRDWSWQKSAGQYEQVYQRAMTAARQGTVASA